MDVSCGCHVADSQMAEQFEVVASNNQNVRETRGALKFHFGFNARTFLAAKLL